VANILDIDDLSAQEMTHALIHIKMHRDTSIAAGFRVRLKKQKDFGATDSRSHNTRQLSRNY
jgi:hypothetical protein